MATNQTIEILTTLTTLSSIATLYNEYAVDAGSKPVNKFSDKVAAIRRTVAVLDALHLELVADAKSARGFIVEGSYTDEDHQVDPTEDAIVDAHDASNALISAAVAANPELAAMVAAPAGWDTVAATRQRSVAVSENSTISVVSETNPKRKGSEAAARFALYRDGMTVAQYLDAADALGHMSDRHKYRADLRWDEAHGFIRIEDAQG